MKKIYRIIICLLLSAALMLPSSCKSTESAETSAAVTSPEPVVTSTVPIQNMNYTGVRLDEKAVIAASALPVPKTPPVTSSSSSDTVTEEELVIPPSDETLTEPPVTGSTAPETVTAPPASSVSVTETSASSQTVPSDTGTPDPVSSSGTPSDTTAPPVTESGSSAGVYTPGSYTKNTYQALNHDYVKAVWISYIELANHFFGKDESFFRKGFADMLDNCVSVGINTVYVHVRAFGDAYYYSDLFPFTKQIVGVLGKKASFDPLEIMISEAHKRNISFHAWINPLRLSSDADMKATSVDFPTGKWYNGPEKGKYLVYVDGRWYLNPAYGDVRELISDGVREIVSRYNVDAIHIDDYFYPTTDASFDSAAYEASGYKSLASFRIDACNAMVRSLYKATHDSSTAIFGVAPQGSNYNNLYVLYADTAAWCKGGYVDYFAPQIYYGFENKYSPYKACLDEWVGIVEGTGTALCPGLALYKAGNDSLEWQSTTTMLKRQIEYADEKGCDGVAIYCYSYMFDDGFRTAATLAEVENFKPLLKK